MLAPWATPSPIRLTWTIETKWARFGVPIIIIQSEPMISEEVRGDPLIKDVVREHIDLWNEPLEDNSEREAIEKEYDRYIFRKWAFTLVIIIATIIVVGIALTLGDYPIEFMETFEIIWDHLAGNIHEPLEDNIIFELRLPRILTGILAGAGLAMAGVVMQSTLLNPLAEPYTTGVSSGAGFGATIAIVLGFTIGGITQYGIVINAFVFSLIPMAIILLVAKLKNSSPTTTIMAGIAVMYIFNAFTTLISLGADPDSLQQVYRWMVGSLAFVTSGDVPVIAFVVIISIIALMGLSNKLNILSTGDESAKSLGVDAEKLRRMCLIIVAVLSATIVSFTGLIGFVGLVAPHIVRTVIGPDNRYLLPASAAFGSLLLVISDIIGKVIVAPAQLQVGVITAFLGGPLFLWLILRKKSVMWG